MGKEILYGIWIYCLERPENREGTTQTIERRFLYGYSLPLEKDYPLNKYEESKCYFKENDSQDLVFVEINQLVSISDHDQIVNNLRNENISKIQQCANWGIHQDINFARRPLVIQSDPDTIRESYPRLIEESIAPFLSLVESFYVLDKEKLLDSAIGAATSLSSRDYNSRLVWILNNLQNHTGLSFKNAYIKRLGNFDIFSFPLGSVHTTPGIDIIVKKNIQNNDVDPKGIFIKRNNALSAEDHIAHVILRNGGEVIFDQIHKLHINQKESALFEAQETISEYEVKIYGNYGKNLIFHERRSLVREIHLGMNLMGNTRIIQDKFSHKLRSDNRLKDLAEEVENTSSLTPDRLSIVGSHKSDPWIVAGNNIANYVHPKIVPPEKGRWFNKSIKGEAEAILHLRKLSDEAANHTVILADPFFGEISFMKWLLRLRNHNTFIQVITSLPLDTDFKPNLLHKIKFFLSRIFKGHRNVRNNKNLSENESIPTLIRLCKYYQAIIPSNLQIINLRRGNDQAFHDRYLVCIKNDGDVKVYMLSNSINKAAGNYPLCVVELSTGLSREVYEYLLELEQGNDISSTNIILKRDVLWPQLDVDKDNKSTNRANQDVLETSFPFCITGLRWLLDDEKSSTTELINIARIKHFINDSNEWNFNKENILQRIKADSGDVFNKNIDKASLVLASIGEIIARTPDGRSLLNDLSGILYNFLKRNNGYYILDKISSFYKDDPSTKNYWGSIPNQIDLTSKSIYDEKTISRRLLDQAISFLRYSFDRQSRLYGLSYAYQIISQDDPNSAVKWLENVQHMKLRTAAITFSVNSLSYHNQRELIPALLKSSQPFYKMLGAAFMHYTDTPPYSFDEAVRYLRNADFKQDDIVWIMAERVTSAQINWFRIKDPSHSDDELMKAEHDLLRTIDNLASIWPSSALEPDKNIEFESGIRHRTIDRYRIAEALDKLTSPNPHKGSETLYIKCIEDLEELIGRGSDNLKEDFHFYGDDDFNSIEAAALSFVNINKGSVARIFRNRENNHIDLLLKIISKPFSRRRDFYLWNANIGRAGVALLWGYTIIMKSYESGERDNLDLMSLDLLSKTRLLLLSSLNKWYDINGLLDNLIRIGTSTTFDIVDNDRTANQAEQIVDDERLPSYFRGCVACLHPVAFKNNPTKAYDLLRQQRHESGDRQITRYFHLLDIFIGRASQIKSWESSFINSEIDSGLEKYPNINEKWRNFFENVWDALKGDSYLVNKILEDPDQRKTFCGYLLMKDTIENE